MKNIMLGLSMLCSSAAFADVQLNITGQCGDHVKESQHVLNNEEANRVAHLDCPEKGGFAEVTYISEDAHGATLKLRLIVKDEVLAETDVTMGWNETRSFKCPQASESQDAHSITLHTTQVNA